MASSFLFKVGAAAAIYAAQASATKSYQVTDVYDSTNFLEKFEFISTTDPNGGYVSYQSQENAEDLELVQYKGDEIYIGVDHTSNGYVSSGAGRKSVRLESRTTYNKGLIVADFSHLPKPVCGSWPSFWLFGEPWPTKGEVDIYENWNDLTFNRLTAHVAAPSVVGECTIVSDGMLATVDSSNCYDFATGQSSYQGCSASHQSETFGSASGGIFAMEWTSEYIRMWDWTHDAAPADILNGKPEPSLSTWGTPSYVINECDIEKAFSDMKLVFTLDFCAVAGQTGIWGASCKASTKHDYCTGYVASQGADFKDVYFQVKDIKYYELAEAASQTTSSQSTSSTTTATSSSSLSTNSTLSLTTSSTAAGTSTTSSSVRITSTHIFTNSSTAALPTATPTVSDEDEGDEETPISYPTATYVPVTTSTEAPEMTTSTLYATTVYTVTLCAPTVTNCPAHHHVTTETISIGTTVCPVTRTGSSPKSTTVAHAGVAEGYITRTVEVTRIYTVTSCEPTVTNCPVGSLATEVSTTTTVARVVAGPTAGTPAEYAGAGSKSEGPAMILETETETPLLPTTEHVSKPSPTTASAASGNSYVTDSGSGSSSGSNNGNGGAGAVGSSASSSTGSASNVEAIITATVIPVTSANMGYYGYNGILSVSVTPAQSTGYSTSYVSESGPGSSSSSGSKADNADVVEVNGGMRVGASLALVGVAAFILAM